MKHYTEKEQEDMSRLLKMHLNKQNSYQRVSIVQDDSSHWYVIPYEDHDEFQRLVEKEEDEQEFNDKFSQYSTGGCLSNIKLYQKL